MTYTFFNPNNGIHIIYDTASGAVIKCGELEAYICDAMDPCGELSVNFPEKCPSDIRYELARYSSTEVSSAYEKIKKYSNEGLLFRQSDVNLLRLSGPYSADRSIIPLIISKTGINENEINFIND